MKKGFDYKIEYTADDKTGQIVATIPELNHVSSFGSSFAEAEANVREAALGYLEVLRADKIVTVPVHGSKDIPIGTLHNIVIHQAGLSVDYFNSLK